MRAVAIVISVAAIGCDGTSAGTAGCSVDALVDATPPGPCWPDTTRTPKGWAVLGTGRDRFEPMPEILPLEYGVQDGFNLVAHVRMSGFLPGNPQDFLDPANPRTRIRAFFADSNVPLNYFSKCPFRIAYVPSPLGDYELNVAAPVVFETCWRSEHLFGKQIRIELELTDDTGGYTTDQKIVTAAPPTSGPYPEEEGTPGCVHP